MQAPGFQRKPKPVPSAGWPRAGLLPPSPSGNSLATLGFVDLHSHVLPGLDDGAADAIVSMNMLRGLADLGFETVCATPHQRAGMFLPSLEAMTAAHRAVCAALASAGVALTVPLAAENMWDGVFHERLASRSFPFYDGGPAFLFEVPVGPALPVGLDQQLFELELDGRLPVLAHPERYPPIYQNLDRAVELAKFAALVVDLGAVAGYHGKPQGKAARKLLENGIAHAVASDVHSTTDVRVAAEGMAWIEKKLGRAALVRLLDESPRRILAGELPR
jgi:protein-tyrosine phosphatase